MKEKVFESLSAEQKTETNLSGLGKDQKARRSMKFRHLEVQMGQSNERRDATGNTTEADNYLKGLALGEGEKDIKSLTSEDRYEVNNRYWELVEKNPDSEVSILDFVRFYENTSETEQNSSLNNNQRDVPSILRDGRGRVRWRLIGQDDRQNLQLGITNVQALFLRSFPEFNRLFPRDEHNLIPEEKREAARKFILDNIGSIQKFLKTFGNSPVNAKITPYFGGAFSIVLKKTFADWGIDFRNKKLMQFLLQGEDGFTQMIEADDQTKGIQNLKDLFKGVKTFSEINPFVIFESHGYKKGRGEFYVAAVDGKSITFQVNQRMLDVFSQGRLVLVIPREDLRRLYQWLDFYEIDEKGNTKPDSLIHSSRVDANSLKIDSKSWFGLEKQLFLDYLSGKPEIELEYLQEFRSILQRNRQIFIGNVNEKKIEIYIGNPLCSPGQEIISRPLSDPSGHNTFLEGYVRGAEGLIQVYSRRFHKGNLKLLPGKKIRKRGDLSIDAFTDWLKGAIPFDEAEPLTLVVNNKNNTIFFSNKFMRFGSQVQQGDEIVIVPQKDEFYEWIEVKRKDEKKEVGFISIGSYRLTRSEGVKLDGHWPGPEKQRWIDYLEGKRDFSIMGSLFETVGNGYRVSLFTWRGRRFQLTLGKSFTLGEQVKIIPYLTQNNDLLFEVSSLQNLSSKKIFIIDERSARLKSLLERNIKKEINFGSLTNEDRLEINERYWDFLEKNPDVEVSIIDLTRKYLKERS